MSEVTYSPVDWVAEHTKRYVESGGEDGHEWHPGVPTLLLTTTGRKSGVKRRTALIYGRDTADYVIVASNGGTHEHPALPNPAPGRHGCPGFGRPWRGLGRD